MTVLLAALGVFAICLVLAEYGGPGNIFVRLRNQSPKWISDPLKCVVCSSWWIAVPFAIFLNFNVLEYLGTVGGAIVIYLVSTK